MIFFPKRGDVYWVNLNPTVGTEINKKRPAVIISNNTGNEFSSRIIIAPITSQINKIYPFEVGISLKSKSGKILLDQLRCIDKIRLGNLIAPLDANTISKIDIVLKKVLALN